MKKGLLMLKSARLLCLPGMIVAIIIQSITLTLHHLPPLTVLDTLMFSFQMIFVGIST